MSQEEVSDPGRRGPGGRGCESRPVSRVLSRTVIPLGQPSLIASSDLPESSAGHAYGFLFGLAPGGVYLATNCCQPCGALLPHLFTLTGTEVLRRLFSVALSVGSRLPGVTWHSALRSPDFPPPASDTAMRWNLNGQRLSDRLSGAKSTGRCCQEQALPPHISISHYCSFCFSSAT